MSDFQVGDVIILKSGGPAMTVSELVEDFRTKEPLLRCTWFDDRNNLQHSNFSPLIVKPQVE